MRYLKTLDVCRSIILVSNRFRHLFFDRDDKKIQMVKDIISYDFGQFESSENNIINFNFYSTVVLLSKSTNHIKPNYLTCANKSNQKQINGLANKCLTNQIKYK